MLEMVFSLEENQSPHLMWSSQVMFQARREFNAKLTIKKSMNGLVVNCELREIETATNLISGCINFFQNILLLPSK